MHRVEEIHPNSKGVLQVHREEHFEDLAETMVAVDQALRNGSPYEQTMFAFFEREVEAGLAYRDTSINQGCEGPKKLHVAGKLSKMFPTESDPANLCVRLGIAAPDEHPLIPSLQVLYSRGSTQVRYIKGEPVGMEDCVDRWAYEFTERYHGMIDGVSQTRTPEGLKSLGWLLAIDKALETGQPLEVPASAA